ncbi:MAG: Gfo/Idh/MocA family oxidoreductase [Bryobacterales bacterium]|jgi:predicted dehydrogenase|nr:Gfo/Idh/MocA family oxidoreductase [Bryobacterales bacterium]
MTQRRRFLFTALSAVATAPLALRVPLHAAPIEGRIRTGIWGTQHSHTTGKLKAMQGNPDYDVVGISESDVAQRAQAEKSAAFAGLRWMTHQQMLADPGIQLIVAQCSVWDALSMGHQVIDAGKHLHLEKPPGNDWKRFQDLIAKARAKNLLVQTGYVWRHHAGVNAALDAARNGWLGDILQVRGTMNADRDAPQRAVEARYKGGGLFELGGHVVDRMVDLLGRPTDVKSWLRHHSSVMDNLNDNGMAVFEFPRTLAVLSQTANQAGAGDHRSFEIIGSDGTFIVWPEANPPRMRIFLRKTHAPYKAGWQDVVLPPQPRFVGDFQELARALKSGQPLRLSYDHELTLHETLLRAAGEI